MCSVELYLPSGDALDDLLSTSAKPVLVVVSAERCAPCRRLSASLPVLARRFVDAVRIVEVDADADAELDFVSRWPVAALPSLLLFRDGHLADRTTGFAGYTALARWVGDRVDRWREAGLPEARDDWARSFEQRAALIEQDYEAATLPAAEAVGRILGPAFEEHETLAAQLRGAREAGTITVEDAKRMIERSEQALRSLGAPELAEQRRVTAVALGRYVEEIGLAAGSCMESNVIADVASPKAPP